MTQLQWVRALFGATMTFHIMFATLGVGLPLHIALAEILALWRREPAYRLMARRLAAAFAVFLGAGVVSGTIVALQLTLLWPAFMRLVGQIIALPFAIEVFAFFVEAVFAAVYIFAADRLRPGLRILSALLVAGGAAASALLITDVNAFMNTPVGFRVAGGRLVDVRPWRAMWNPAMPTELGHVLVSAYLAVALVLGAFAAWGCLGGGTPAARRYHRLELDLCLAVAGVAAVLTAYTGDRAGKFLARVQPVKFAAAEGLFRTGAHLPLAVGGLPDPATQTVRGALRIPFGLLSWLATGRTDGTVLGLTAFPRSDWPPLFVHLLFDLMVAIGGAILAAAAAYWLWRLRARGEADAPRALLWTLVAMGPVGMLGVEAGWVFAEIGRQPWTVTGVLTTAQAATRTPYAGLLFGPFVALYAALWIGAAAAVRHHLRTHPLADALRPPAPADPAPRREAAAS